MRLDKRREVAGLGNCLMCDAYFVVTLCTVAGAAEFSGRKGTARLEDELESIQERYFQRVVYHLPCPTCAELTHGKPWQQFIADVEDEAAIAPGRFVGFEDEPPPLYMNEAAQGKAPKWTLCQGLGPKSLELDKSRSGRIYKPTLRQHGIPMHSIDPETLSSAETRHMLQVANTYSFDLPITEATELWSNWIEQRPLYINWDKIESTLAIDFQRVL